ncbi:MAG: single-stranded DNA-binding protein [Leuconostoc lactis]|uniref:single-stranded DNA-binding protein n=1 Tax=Leuconostoc lactis TaxID=1246 RepID=UPI0039933147
MQTNTHIGRLVHEPQVTIRGEKNTKIAYIKLAINDLPNGRATYIDYVAFNKTAELIEQYLTSKGQIVEVQFVMRNSQYADNQTGEKIYKTQNIITHFRSYNSKNTPEHNSSDTDDVTEKDEYLDDVETSNFNPLDYRFSEE